VKHLSDPDRTATSAYRWTECGQFVSITDIASDEIDCPMCAIVAQARRASVKADSIRQTYPALNDSGVWRPKKK